MQDLINVVNQIMDPIKEVAGYDGDFSAALATIGILGSFAAVLFIAFSNFVH